MVAVVAAGPLDQPPAAGRQVVGHLRRVQRQVVVVDDVEVGAVAGLQHAAVVQADRAGGVARLHAHDLSASGSFGPRVRSRVQWVSSVVGKLPSQIMPTWAPPSERPGTASLWFIIAPRRIEVALGVVQERHVDHAAPAVGEHVVEARPLPAAAPVRRGDRRDRVSPAAARSPAARSSGACGPRRRMRAAHPALRAAGEAAARGSRDRFSARDALGQRRAWRSPCRPGSGVNGLRVSSRPEQHAHRPRRHLGLDAAGRRRPASSTVGEQGLVVDGPHRALDQRERHRPARSARRRGAAWRTRPPRRRSRRPPAGRPCPPRPMPSAMPVSSSSPAVSVAIG